MKFILPVFLICLTIGTVFGLPARDPKNDAEVVSVPRGQHGISRTKDYDDDTDPDFKDFKGVVDTGAGYPFLSPLPYNPFGYNSGFFDNFEDVFRRLRQRLLNSWWSNIPQAGDSDWNAADGNSTSEVKVIDGHKVLVNDTVYTKKDEDGNAIFRVRILNIRPVDSKEETDQTNPTDTTVIAEDNTSGKDKNDVNDNNNDSNSNNNDDENGSPEVLEPKQQKDNEISGNIDSTELKSESLTQTTSTIKTDNQRLHDTNKARYTVENANMNMDKNMEFEDLNVEEHNKDVVNQYVKSAMNIRRSIPKEIESELSESSEVTTIKNLNKVQNKIKTENIVNDETATTTTTTTLRAEEEIKKDNKIVKEEKYSKENESKENIDSDEKDNQKYHEFDIKNLDDDNKSKNKIDKKKHKLYTTNYKIETENIHKNEANGKISTEIDSSEEDKTYKNHQDNIEDNYNSEWDEIYHTHNDGDDINEDVNDNDIDMYESIPVDLSNDIAVNQMLADQDAPINPDAEILSVDELNNQYQNNYPKSSSSSSSLLSSQNRIPSTQPYYQNYQTYIKPGHLSQLTDNQPIKK